MSASILSFLRQKAKQPAPWANDELAELYRVVDILSRAGITVETDHGLSDEGDPWFVFCRADTGEVIAHFARIDGQFVAASIVTDRTFRGRNFREIIDNLATRQPLLIPRPTGDNKLYLHPSVVITAFIATALMHSQNSEWHGSDFSGHSPKESAAGPQDAATGTGKEGAAVHHHWLPRLLPESTEGKNTLSPGASAILFEQGLAQASIIGIAISVLNEITAQYGDTAQTKSTEPETHTAKNDPATAPAAETPVTVAVTSEPSQANPEPADTTSSKPVQERSTLVQEKFDASPSHATLSFAATLQQATEFVPTSDGKSDKIEIPNILDYGKYHLAFLTAAVGEDSVTLPAIGLPAAAPGKAMAAAPSYAPAAATLDTGAAAPSYAAPAPSSYPPSSYAAPAPSSYAAPAASSYTAPAASTVSGSQSSGSSTLDSSVSSTSSDDSQKSVSTLSSVIQNSLKADGHTFFEVFALNAQGSPGWVTLDVGPIFASAPSSGESADKTVDATTATSQSATTLATGTGSITKADTTVATATSQSATTLATGTGSITKADATVATATSQSATTLTAGTESTTKADATVATETTVAATTVAATTTAATSTSSTTTLTGDTGTTDATVATTNQSATNTGATVTTGAITATTGTTAVTGTTATTVAANTAESSSSSTTQSTASSTLSPYDIITGFLNNANDVVTVPVVASDNLMTSLKMYRDMSNGPITIILFNSNSININIFQLSTGVLFVEQHQVSWGTTAGAETAIPGVHSVELSLANGGEMTLLGIISDSHLLAAV